MAPRLGAGRNQQPNSGGGVRTKATRSGRAGGDGSRAGSRQRPAAEFCRRYSFESNPERPGWRHWQQGWEPAETSSRIFPALLVRKQPGAAVLVAEVNHRPPSLNKFRVDRHGPRFAGSILSRAGVRPARDKINVQKLIANFDHRRTVLPEEARASFVESSGRKLFPAAYFDASIGARDGLKRSKFVPGGLLPHRYRCRGYT